MRRLLTTAICLLIVTATPVLAAPPPGQVVQIFGCTLNDGQTADNVWATMDALSNNPTNAENTDPAFGMFLWIPYRGATPYDFAFGVLSSDLNTMAAGSTAYAASPAAQAIGARFASMGGCDSAIMMSDQIAEGAIGMTGGDRGIDAVVETFSCKINEGSDMDDVGDAVEYWQGQIGKIGSGSLDDYQAYVWTPFRGGTGSDFVWVGNYANLAAWAKGSADYSSSDAGQAADARFDDVSSCTNQMWMGYWLTTPKEF